MGRIMRDPDAPFIVKTQAALDALPRWLKERDYNSHSLSTDRNGNTMIGLSAPGLTSRSYHRAGLIIVVNDDLFDAALALVQGRPSSTTGAA